MNSSSVFFYLVALFFILRLRRVLRRKLKQPGELKAGVDERARAFVVPQETAPYWLMIEYLQVGVGALILYTGMRLKIWLVALIVALVVYAGLAYLLHRMAFIQIFTFGYFSFVDPKKDRESLRLATKFIRGATGWGDGLVALLIQVPAWTLLYRLDPGIVAYVAVAFLPFFTVTLLRHLSVVALRVPRPPWISLGTTVVVTPFLCAWLAGSVTWYLKSSGKPLVDSVKSGTPAPARAGCSSKQDRWVVGGRQIRVAVALSGGGYRAAVAHAGLLAALDEQCVPIDYLTTVSGGSITGAAYALGIPPSSFAAHVRRSRPGLPNDLLSFSGVMREWVLPWSSNTAVYSDHFRRVFFSNRTLSDLPDSPRLIVNVTDLESSGLEPREVVFKGRAPALRLESGESLDQATYIADVVAASGAFPGAFQPMRLRWVSDDAATGLRERNFIDGGVIENLGVEGLRRYLTLSSSGSRAPDRPDLLIISDGSQYSTGVGFKRKVELVRLLARTESLSYEALHRELYARYTGRADFWNWSRTEAPYAQVSSVPYGAVDARLATNARDALLTVVVPLTAPTSPPALAPFSICELKPGQSIAAVQQQVSSFDTLNELDPEEAEAAYWLGFNLGRLYSGAIECARLRVTDPTHVCAPIPAQTDLCRPLRDILRQ